MKKISLFALALFTGMSLFAQDQKPQLRTPMAVKTRFGLRAGVNLADLAGKDLPSGATITEAKERTGFVGGVFANIPISGMFRFQPEVDYSQQGGNLQGPSSGSNNTTYNQTLGYINVPLFFQLQTQKGFFIETGPQVGFLMNANRKANTGTNTTEMDNKSVFDKIDFDWGAGLGYLSRIGLGIDARYNYGIANIMQDNNPTTELMKGTWKNNVAQISLIYHIGANK